MRTCPRLAIVSVIIGSLGGGGCVNSIEGDVEIESGVDGPSEDEGSVIVGALNWVETTTLAQGSAQRLNADRVGYLSIPAKGTRCTAFLIADDVVMTNEHCISADWHAENATVSFRRELGVPWSEWATYNCPTFLGDNATLDFALLRCAGNPGLTHGVMELESRSVVTGDSLYVIHQNCDYYTTPSCDPTKKLSTGQVTGTNGDVRHNADTLGGSSGAPVFSSTSHKVFALHHVGVGGNSSGRGSYNAAVPMSSILPKLASDFPSVTLGQGAPISVTTPTGDGFEPNNSGANATNAGSSFSADGLSITSGDRDVFRIELSATSRLDVAVSFLHASGDLDVTLHAGNATSAAIAKSDSANNDENVVVENATPGTYFLVVYGYNNAANNYNLLVTSDAVSGGPVQQSPSTGATVVSVPYQGSHSIGAAAEVDSFQFSTTTTQRSVRIDFSHATGDLDLFVYDANNNLVGKSESVTNTESVAGTFQSGTYIVKVIGYASATGAYTLRVD